MFKADLHCHSTCSDGTFSPSELLHLAKQAGLSGLSITDHDTIAAYTPGLFAEAEKLGICLLTGIECSSEEDVHILGYHVDPTSPSLLVFIDGMQRRRKERNDQLLEKFRKKGITFTEEELKPMDDPSAGRVHVAQILIHKKLATSIRDAFDRYLKEGASCYVPGERCSPEEIIESIHKAKGKAILAHPHLIRKKNILKGLLELPLDGLECYYGILQHYRNAPFVEIAKRKGWIATGGSDFHGKNTPHLTLGCCWVDEATFNKL